MAGHLLKPGSVFGLLAEHRGELFPAGLFADLFPSLTGRPSLPADVAVSVLVLQTLHDLSDRDAVAAVRCDINEQASTVTCPNNVTRHITAKHSVTFGVACRACPLRARCTTSTTSTTGRSLDLHPHDALLRQARHQWRTDEHLRAT